MAAVDVLIPTCGRPLGLAMLLTSLLGQTFRDFDVVVSDQTPAGEAYLQSKEIQTVCRALEWHGHKVKLLTHLPARGLAEQRQFLLDQSRAPYVHYLDDDVLLDPQTMARTMAVIRREGCGFVGCPATGLHLIHDVRPHEQNIELWTGPVRPEPFDEHWVPWDRHRVNNAANPLHLERKLVTNGVPVRYKVAWIGGANVLYDREKLLDVGGFSWWRRLPPEHAGEEVVVQFLLIRRYGGCGILPSGTYHLDLPTTVPDRRHNAVELFGDLLRDLEAAAEEPSTPEHEAAVTR